jgi:hypothetical protein
MPGRTRTCDLRIRNPLSQNGKPLKNNDLAIQESGAYKPAYKKNQKTTSSQLQNIPSDVAEIVAIWLELPGHIKEAIKSLVQTHTAEKK